MQGHDNEFMGIEDKPTKPLNKPSQRTNIQVIVRARPLLASEAG
jgi:hypothetical protein